MIVLRMFDYEDQHTNFEEPVNYPRSALTNKELITPLATMVPAEQYERSSNLHWTFGVLDIGWIMYVLSFLALTRLTDSTKYWETE